MKKISDYVRENRTKMGLTQAEMAGNLGLKSGQYISNIERGLASVPMRNIELFASVLCVPQDELIEIVKAQKMEDIESKVRRGITRVHVPKVGRILSSISKDESELVKARVRSILTKALESL